MNIFQKSKMKQTATYWGPIVDDGRGSGSFPSPVTIKCRWEDKTEKFIDTNGEQRVSSAVVYPDRLLTVGGWLYEGTSTAADPRTVTGAQEIRKQEKHPSISATQMQVMEWL